MYRMQRPLNTDYKYLGYEQNLNIKDTEERLMNRNHD